MHSFTCEFISTCTDSVNTLEANYVSNTMLTDCTPGFDPAMFSTHHSSLSSLPGKLLLDFKTWWNNALQTELCILTPLAHQHWGSLDCSASVFSEPSPGVPSSQSQPYIESKNPKAGFCLPQTLYLSVVTPVPLREAASYTTASLEIQENQHHQGMRKAGETFSVVFGFYQSCSL